MVVCHGRHYPTSKQELRLSCFSGRDLSLVKISGETLTAKGMSSAASLPFLGSAYRKTSEAECGDSRRSAKQPLP